MNEKLTQLAALLEQRLEVIADQDMRENDPDQQLKLLQEVSENISSMHQELAGQLKPRLAHFLENCSYEKALAWIREEVG